MVLNYACVTLVKSVQQIHYGDIISKLKHKDKPHTKHPPIIQQLGLYLDDNNLIRCKGRLQNTQLPYNAKYTVMIPAESYLATLMVRDTHLIVLHGGLRDTLTQLRQSYWIPKGRQLVKKELKRCVTCKKLEGLAIPISYLSSLTRNKSHRIPTQKKLSKSTSVSTCAAIRVIHLEIAENQTASSFLRAFRRFISRRRIPEYIISDNAKTFKAGSQELTTLQSQILNAAEPQRFLAHHRIK